MESPNSPTNPEQQEPGRPEKESLTSFLRSPRYWMAALLPLLCIILALILIGTLIPSGSEASGQPLSLYYLMILPLTFGAVISFTVNFIFPFVTNKRRVIVANFPVLLLSVILMVIISATTGGTDYLMFAIPCFGILFLILNISLMYFGWLGVQTSRSRHRWRIFGAVLLALPVTAFLVSLISPLPPCPFYKDFQASISSLSTTTSEIDGMPLVYVPAGEFTMGSDDPDQGPAHSVFLDGYWIDQHEVTRAQYALCVAAGVCREPRYFSSYSKYQNYPVVDVNWQDADTYCRWAGRRLPTEAEWEKAARGTDGRIYPWGNAEPTRKLLNFDRIYGGTTPVGCFSPAGDSPYGVWDMAGNVAEWVNDWYQETYYASSPASNPQGPERGVERVQRGGSWMWEMWVLVTDREKAEPELDLEFYGFRCATSP